MRKPLYFVAMVVDAVGSGMWAPLALLFLSRMPGMSVEQAGVALTVGGLASLGIGPLGGALTDRLGPGFAVQASNVLRAAAFGCFPLAATVWEMAVLAAVIAAADRLFWTANAPLLGTMVADREVDRLLGVQTVVRLAGFGAGAGLAGVVAGLAGRLPLVAYANSVTFVLATVLAMPALRGTRPVAATAGQAPRQSGYWGDILRDRPFLLLCAVQFCFALAGQSFSLVLPLVAVRTLDGPVWLSGASVVLGSATVVVAQLPLLRASSRTTRLRALLVATVVLTLAFLLLSTGAGWGGRATVPIVLGGAVLGALGQALAQPLMIAAANDAAGPQSRGRYSAVFQTVWSLAISIAPASFTGLLRWGNCALWLSLAVCAACTAPGLFVVSGRLPARCLLE